MKFSRKHLARRRGQAELEYILVVFTTLLMATVAVTGVEIGDVGTDTGSSVDVSDVQVARTKVISIPGLKDAMYVYQDRLFRWVSEKKSRERIW